MQSRCSVIVQDLVRVFSAHANSERAVGMSAYMRNLLPFFGISSQDRRKLQQETLRNQGGSLTIEEAFTCAEALYAHQERELHYAACDILVKALSKKALSLLLDYERTDYLNRTEALLTQHQWWDTVDVLAPRVAGGLLRGHHTLLDAWTLKWANSDDFWLQRSAIICQLHYKQETDADIVYRSILMRANSKEFFVRKAAGWALRQYGYVNSRAVAEFVAAHPELSGLTKREALKRLVVSRLRGKDD